VFPVRIGLRDPRSQKRDLGHPSISLFDIAVGTSCPGQGRAIEVAVVGDSHGLLPDVIDVGYKLFDGAELVQNEEKR
jgi:hypothetical protein